MTRTPADEALEQIDAPLRRFLIHVGGQSADDLAAETRLILLRRLRAGDTIRHPTAFALRVAWNQVRKLGNKPGVQSWGPEADSAYAADPTRLRDLRQWVLAAFERLDRLDRAILALRHGESLTHREIAAVLDLPPGSVGDRLQRAESELRRWLQRLGNDEPPPLLGALLPLVFRETPTPPLCSASSLAATALSGGIVMKKTLIVAGVIAITLVGWFAFLRSGNTEGSEIARGNGTAEANPGSAGPGSDSSGPSDDTSIATEAYGDRKKNTSIGRGFSVTCRVVEKATGTPVPGAEVILEFMDPNTLKQVAPRKGLTDSAGVFRAAGCPTGVRPACTVRARGFAPALAFLDNTEPDPTTGEIVDLGEVLVQPGATVVGVVLDDVSGKPLAGARVAMCFTPYGSSLGPDALTSSRGVTGANGRFIIRDVHSTRGSKVFVQADGYAPAEKRAPWRFKEDVGGRTFDLGEIRLGVGTCIEGRAFVRDTSAPLAGARLLLFRGSNVHLIRGHRRDLGRTALDGTFSIEHLPAEPLGNYTLFALTAEHCGVGRVTVVKGRRRLSDIEVIADGSARLTVEVRNPQGSSVVGATVQANPSFSPLGGSQPDLGVAIPELISSEARALFSGRTGPDGRCALPHLPTRSSAGVYSIVVSRGARHLAWLPRVRVAASEMNPLLVLVTEAPLTVAGQVTDAENNAIAGARVTCGPTRATTGADGRYLLTGVAAVPAQSLEVEAQGFVGAQTYVTYEPGTALPEINLTVSRRRPVSGRVVDDTGEPVQVRLNLRRRGPGRSESLQLLTDRSGRFRFENATEGAWVLSVTGSVSSWERLAIEVVGGQENIEMALVRRAIGVCRLVAHITDTSGAPLEPLTARIRHERGFSRLASRQMGLLTSDRLLPGRWTITTKPRGAARVEVPFVVNPGEDTHELDVHIPCTGSLEVEVKAGAQVDLSTLSATVSVPRQQVPASDIWIARWNSRRIDVDSTGRFTARDVPPGRAHVRIAGPADVGEAYVTIHPSRTDRVTVRVGPPGTLVFAGTAPKGTQHVLISTRTAAGPWIQQLCFSPSTEGRFERTLRLPPGDSSWRVAYEAGGSQRLRKGERRFVGGTTTVGAGKRFVIQVPHLERDKHP